MDYNDHIKIVSYNTEGFSLNRQSFISDVLINSYSSDIICLQEHWKYNSELKSISRLCDQYKFDSYSISSMPDDRPRIGRGYGGLCIMWKKSISSNIVQVKTLSNRTIAIRLTLSEDNIMLLINTYLPNDNYSTVQNSEGFIEELETIQQILSENEDCSNIVINGDLNCDLSRSSANVKYIKDFVDINDLSFACNLRSSDLDYTHYNAGSSSTSLIDHMIISGSISSVTNSYT